MNNPVGPVPAVKGGQAGGPVQKLSLLERRIAEILNQNRILTSKVEALEVLVNDNQRVLEASLALRQTQTQDAEAYVEQKAGLVASEAYDEDPDLMHQRLAEYVNHAMAKCESSARAYVDEALAKNAFCQDSITSRLTAMLRADLEKACGELHTALVCKMEQNDLDTVEKARALVEEKMSTMVQPQPVREDPDLMHHRLAEYVDSAMAKCESSARAYVDDALARNAFCEDSVTSRLTAMLRADLQRVCSELQKTLVERIDQSELQTAERATALIQDNSRGSLLSQQEQWRTYILQKTSDAMAEVKVYLAAELANEAAARAEGDRKVWLDAKSYADYLGTSLASTRPERKPSVSELYLANSGFGRIHKE